MISDVMVAMRVRKCGRWLKTSPYPSPQETIAPKRTSNTTKLTYLSPSGLPGPTAAVFAFRLQAFRAQQLLSILAAMSAPTMITAVPSATIIAHGWCIPQLVPLVML